MGTLKDEILGTIDISEGSAEFEKYRRTVLDEMKKQVTSNTAVIDSDRVIRRCYDMLHKEIELFQEEGGFVTVSWEPGRFEEYYKDIL